LNKAQQQEIIRNNEMKQKEMKLSELKMICIKTENTLKDIITEKLEKFG